MAISELMEQPCYPAAAPAVAKRWSADAIEALFAPPFNDLPRWRTRSWPINPAWAFLSGCA